MPVSEDFSPSNPQNKTTEQNIKKPPSPNKRRRRSRHGRLARTIDRRIGLAIKSLRRSRNNLTQAGLAARATARGTVDITQQRLSKIERGSSPSPAELFAIAAALQVDVYVFDLSLTPNEIEELHLALD